MYVCYFRYILLNKDARITRLNAWFLIKSLFPAEFIYTNHDLNFIKMYFDIPKLY